MTLRFWTTHFTTILIFFCFQQFAVAGAGSMNVSNTLYGSQQESSFASPSGTQNPQVSQPYGGGDFSGDGCTFKNGCPNDSSVGQYQGSTGGIQAPPGSSPSLPLPPPPPPGASTGSGQNGMRGNGSGASATKAQNQNPGNNPAPSAAANPNSNAGNGGTQVSKVGQQVSGQAMLDACTSAFSLAEEACKGPLGGGMNNAGLIQVGGQVGSALAMGAGQVSTTAAGIAQNCGMGAHIAALMAGGFATYAAACSAAQSSCMASCTGSDLTSIQDRIQCQGYAAYTQQGMTGLLQYGSSYIQAENCVKAAKANQLLVDCSAAGSSNNPQCATDCQVATNQGSPYCQAYFAANPCQAPDGTSSKACLCSQNPSDPVCTGVTTPAATPLALSPSSPGATSNGSLLAQFANQGNPGGLNRNPLYKGNKLGNTGPGFGGPLAARGQGGGLPNLGGNAGAGFGSGSSSAGNRQDPGFNTNINKGFVSSNAVLPVPLSSAGGAGGGAYRAPASIPKPFTMASLQNLLPSFAGQGGFRVLSKNAPKFGNPEITAADGLSNWQKVHLQYLRMAADHELMP